MYELLCSTKIKKPLENWLDSQMKLNNIQNEEFGVNYAKVKKQIFEEKFGKQQYQNIT